MALELIARMDLQGGGNIQVWSDIRAMSKGLNALSKTGVPRAIARATNKSLLKTRTQARKAIGRKYNLPAKVINPEITKRNATRTNPSAYIQGRGSQIPIFKTKGSKTQKRLGVSVNTGTGRRVIKHTFIATMPSGHVGVYKRRVGGRVQRIRYINEQGKPQTKTLPITELQFPSTAHMITNPSNATKLFNFFTNDYPIQVQRQLNAEWDKVRGR